MIRRSFAAALLNSALLIPTQSLDNWKIETFSKISSNEVSSSSNGLLVKVRKSASPMIYALKTTERITAFKVSGDFKSLPKFKNIAEQGERGADDFPFRLGLIVPGDKKLSGVKRLFAPQWVKKLYEQVPSGLGLDHIYFFNVTQNKETVGRTRTHPQSDLIKEENFALVEKPGPFSYRYVLKNAIDAVAIWISIDGDDTGSDYEVLLSEIELTTALPSKELNPK